MLARTLTHDPIAWWRGKYGAVPPIGYELRDHWGAHWSRFHSLPNSKRYPSTAEEYAEMHKRAAALGRTIFTPEEPIYVLHSTYAFDDLPTATLPPALSEFLSATRSRFEIEGGEAMCHTRAFTVQWPFTQFATLIRHVADEDISMLIFISPESRNALCPYDGGFDVFTPAIPPEKMRGTFPNWLSDRADFL
jgi:hypothetical protein